MFLGARVMLAAAVVMALSVCDAGAQIGNRLAVGASVIGRLANSSDAGGGTDVGLEIRMARDDPGWGWQGTFFNWFDTGVREPITARPMAVGNLRVRPILAGFGYTWNRGHTTITADVVGGYTVNSFELSPAALAEYSQRLGATGVESEATNAFAIKPEIQVWYDLNRRFGLKLTGGYLRARPSVVVRSSLGQDVRPVRADTVLVTVGVLYSIF